MYEYKYILMNKIHLHVIYYIYIYAWMQEVTA